MPVFTSTLNADHHLPNIHYDSSAQNISNSGPIVVEYDHNSGRHGRTKDDGSFVVTSFTPERRHSRPHMPCLEPVKEVDLPLLLTSAASSLFKEAFTTEHVIENPGFKPQSMFQYELPPEPNHNKRPNSSEKTVDDIGNKMQFTSLSSDRPNAVPTSAGKKKKTHTIECQVIDETDEEQEQVPQSENNENISHPAKKQRSDHEHKHDSEAEQQKSNTHTSKKDTIKREKHSKSKKSNTPIIIEKEQTKPDNNDSPVDDTIYRRSSDSTPIHGSAAGNRKKRPKTPYWICYDPEITRRLEEKYSHAEPIHLFKFHDDHGPNDVHHDHHVGHHHVGHHTHFHHRAHDIGSSAHHVGHHVVHFSSSPPKEYFKEVPHNEHHTWHLKSHETAQRVMQDRSSSHEHLPSIMFRENISHHDHSRPATEQRRKSHSFSFSDTKSAGHRRSSDTQSTISHDRRTSKSHEHVSNAVASEPLGVSHRRSSKSHDSVHHADDHATQIQKKVGQAMMAGRSRSKSMAVVSDTEGMASSRRVSMPAINKAKLRSSLWGAARKKLDNKSKKDNFYDESDGRPITPGVAQIEFEARWSKTRMITSRAATADAAILDDIEFWRKFPPKHEVFQLEDPTLRANTFILRHPEDMADDEQDDDIFHVD